MGSPGECPPFDLHLPRRCQLTIHSYRIQLIAVRVICAARELDLPIVALRSRDEADALHARMADEVVVFDVEGPRSAASSRRRARGPPGRRCPRTARPSRPPR
ncbi:biotin carboxylase N-terminal domain-containing protein [Streptomyces sp. enrichment culture]|uniref:biotin carboxylase N-terminal domain-containing protein n=1 Tax=Streptomyces sp. enrichment culture TaxID=1795815 RepID=UPI003F5474E4